MPITAEQLTVIRAGLDASAYQAGANVVLAANQSMATSGEPVIAATERVTRAHLGAQRQLEAYSRATIEGYAEVSKFAQAQDNLNRIVSLGLTTQANASNILSVYAERFGLVTAQARVAAQAIQDIQIKSIAAADAMQRASQAQAAFNARSGAPGVSAPVAGAGYGVNTSGGNPLYGDARASRQADLDAYGAALDSVRAKYAPMFAAQQQYERQLAEIAQAVSTGAITESEAATARERVAQTYLSARDAINAYAIAQRDAAALDDQRQASIAQAAYNARSGALGSNPLYGAAYDARQSDIEAAFADADKQRAAVDQLYAVSKQYEGVLEQIQALNRTGVFNDAQTQAAMDRAQVNYQRQIDGINRAEQAAEHGAKGMHAFGNGSAFATREIIVMGDEILRGNFSRIPGSILVLTSHVQVLRESLVGLVTSFTGLSILGGLAAAGGLAAFGYAAESSARQVEAIQNRLALSRPDYASAQQTAYTAARQMALATGDSSSDARTGAGELLANQSFQGTAAQAAAVTGAFYDLSKALGDQTTDWKRMGEAINDPVQFLKSMQGILADVTPALIAQAQHLQDSGDKAHAFALAMRAVQDGVRDVPSHLTPLQKALQDLENEFVRSDGSAKTWSNSLGSVIDATATHFVNGLKSMIDGLNSLDSANDAAINRVRQWLHIPEEGVFGSAARPSPGLAGNTALSSEAQSRIRFEALQEQFDSRLEALAERVANQESHGNQYGPDGSVLRSSAGALGMFQVMPDVRNGTTRTIDGVVYDLTDTAQNIAAGMHYLGDLYRQYQGDEVKTAAAYNAGPGVVSGQVTQSPVNRAQTAAYVAAVASDASSSGTYGAYGVLSGTDTSGVVNNRNDIIARAAELSNGSQASQLASIQDKIRALTLALAQTGLTTQQITAFTQELQKAQLEAYNAALPAAQAMYRTIDLQTGAEERLASAWTQGAAAAELVVTQTKAETEARSAAAPGTAAYAQTVAGLTAHYVALAAATRDVALAQKLNTDQSGLTYIQAEANSLTMSDEARTVYLARLKEEQDLDRQGVAAGDPYRKSLTDIAGATAQANYQLQTMGQTLQGGLLEGWKEITKNVNDTGDAFKNLATSSLAGAEDAFAKFVETGKLNMHDLLQSIETDLIKLAEKTLIEQPIMNALGYGGTGNLWTALFGNGFGGTQTGAGSTTAGSQTPGSNNGSSLLGPVGGLIGLLGKSPGVDTLGAGISNLLAGNAFDGMAAGANLASLSAQAAGNIAGGAAGLHSGGVVGRDATFYRDVPASTFYGAPRFHDGLNSDEFAAILQKGERVLTQKQDAAVTGVLKAAGNEDSKPASGGNTIVHNWNITTPDVRGFARSQAQVTALVSRSAGYTAQRLGRP